MPDNCIPIPHTQAVSTSLLSPLLCPHNCLELQAATPCIVLAEQAIPLRTALAPCWLNGLTSAIS